MEIVAYMVNRHDDHYKTSKQVDGFNAVTVSWFDTAFDKNGCRSANVLHVVFVGDEKTDESKGAGSS